MKQYTTATVGLLILLGVLGGLAWYQWSGVGDVAAARATVRDFGLQLKNVPLAAEEEVVQESIGGYYSPFVTKDLLTAWITDVELAPGRLTSSPWPDRIEIVDMTEQGAGYVVRGDIVLMTSAEVTSEEDDNAGTVPVIIQLVPVDGGWRIAAYQEQASQE
jgi:bla regulator protein BlaR1